MTDLVRRIVSGNKARFRDGDLDVDLDLAYITDHVIVMGYPAVGVEGLYRNRREDAKKFLNHRHGQNYWVFNFCPIKENAYDPAVFDGRVSRYPFPDHHAPPLAILALVAREMRLWLDGSPERVAVLHCKAGKGRSGTMACAYLLSLDTEPTPPRLERNYNKKELARLAKLNMPLVQPQDPHKNDQVAEATPTMQAGEKSTEDSAAKKEWAKERAEEYMNEMPADDATAPPPTADNTDVEGELSSPPIDGETENTPPTETEKAMEEAKSEGVAVADFAVKDPQPVATGNVLGEARVDTPPNIPSISVSEAGSSASVASAAAVAEKSKRSSLANILDLHTARRMQADSPSSSSSESSTSSSEERRKAPQEVERPGPPPKKGKAGVSIPSQRRWLYYWSLVLSEEGPAGFWPPLHYPPTTPHHEPALIRPRVRVLDIKIRMHETKGVKLGVVKAASMLLERLKDKVNTPAQYGAGDLWVSMARYDDDLVDTLETWERWSREVGIGGMGKRRSGGEKITPRSSENTDVSLKEEIHNIFIGGKWDTKKMVRSFARLAVIPEKETREGKVVTETLKSKDDDSVVLDANREVRFKIYTGKVFMSWFWLIPAFHLPPASSADGHDPVTISFAREDLDFAIGLGSSLVEVQVTMQRIRDDSETAPAPRLGSGDSEVGAGQEHGAGIVGGVVSALEGQVGIRQGVEIQQGLDE